MNTITRYILLILGIFISLHYILSFTHEEYGRATSFSQIASHFKGSASTPPKDEVVVRPPVHPPPTVEKGPRRANASFVILARNSDLAGTLSSIRELENRFNSRYNYPYVLLNEIPFTEEFQSQVSAAVSSSVEFGVIPNEHWYQPDWIDEDKATKSRNQMMANGVKYGGSVPYRNMCRFNSGFFFRHPLLLKYRWYWRVEPSVHYHCDINTDPFLFMEDNDKVYSFTITVYEISATIPSLWGHVKDFIEKHPEYVAPNNSMGFISNNDGISYNTCHFWSNFEIADMNFWRGPAYTAFFEYLDSTGGFYYERWGDAPVHSIAASLFARRDQLHFFEEIGYQHDDWSHCPLTEQKWEKGKCSCDRGHSFDYDPSSCKRRWDQFENSWS